MIDVEYYNYVDQTLKTESDRYFDPNLNLLIVPNCQIPIHSTTLFIQPQS